MKAIRQKKPFRTVLFCIVTVLLSGVQAIVAQSPYMTVIADPTLCLGQDTIMIRAFPNCMGCQFTSFYSVSIDGQPVTFYPQAGNPTTVLVPQSLPNNSGSVIEVVFNYLVPNGLTQQTPPLLDTLNILPRPVVTYPTLPLCNSPGLSFSPTNAPSGLLFSLSSGGLIIPSTGEVYPMGQVLPDTVHWVDSTLCHYSGEIPLTFQSPTVSSSWNYGLPHCVHNASPVAPSFIAPSGTFSMNPVTGVVLNSMSGSIQTSPQAPMGIYPVTFTYPLSQCSLPSIALLELQNDSVAMVCPTDSFCEGTGWTLPPMIQFMPGIAAGGIFSSPGLNTAWMDSPTGAVNTDSVMPGQYLLNYQTQGNACNRTYRVAGEIKVIPKPDPSFTYPDSVYCIGSGSASPSMLGTTGIFGYLPSADTLVLDPNTGLIDLAQSDPGHYTIWHRVTRGNACAATDSFDILLASLGSSISVGPSLPSYCRYDTITLNVTGAPAGGTWAVNSTNGPLVLAQGDIPGRFLANGLGQFWISYTAPGNCAATGGDSVSVTMPAISTFEYWPRPDSVPYCDNTDTLLVPVVNTNGWFSCDPLFTRNDSGYIHLAGTPAGVYLIDFEADGCFFPDQYVLEVHPHPDDSLLPIITPDPLCAGSEATFVTNDGLEHVWYYNDSLESAIDSYTRDFVAVGDTLAIKYITSQRCTALKEIPLPVIPVPVLQVDTTMGWIRRTSEPLILDIHASEPMGEVHWTADPWRGRLDSTAGILHLNDSTAPLTLHPGQRSSDTLMYVTIYLRPGYQGCIGDSLLLRYTVIHPEELALHIPGVFTPDGDGINDTWDITIPEALQSQYNGYTILVFNRAGGLVATLPFGSSGPTLQWSASELPPGVYQYLLQDRDKNVVEQGGVSVLK